jgi:hypothetical protein
VEDVKVERANFEESGKGGKKNGESGLSAEERNKVLVKLISKERVLEFLQESMAAQKERARVESEESEENEKSEQIDNSEIEKGGIEEMSFTRAPPPRSSATPPPLSASLKPSFLYSYLQSFFSSFFYILILLFYYFYFDRLIQPPAYTTTKTRPSSAPLHKSLAKPPSASGPTLTKTRPTTARPARTTSKQGNFSMEDKVDEIMKIYHGSKKG